MATLSNANTKRKIQKFSSLNTTKDLPKDLKISTITSTCNFDTLFNISNIKNHPNLTIKDTKKIKKKDKAKKKKTKQFDNQISVKIMHEKTKLNFKIFKNGAIQTTGSKHFDDFWYGIEYLCKELNEDNYVKNKKKFNTDSINNFKIDMINANFNIGFQIDRNKLSNLLDTKEIKNTFDPEVHAGVILKYNYKNIRKVSIFVFESGSIIITGAKNKYQLLGTYEYINNLLFENYKEIALIDLDKNIKLFLETKIFNEN